MMKVSDFLSSADVTIDAAFADKQKLLEDLAGRAAAIVDLEPDLILAELQKREELGSTGMGGGVAIPHARFHHLRKPFGMLVRLKKPIEFDAVDGKRVDTVALLLLPDVHEGERLGALACYARKLRDPVVMTALRRALDGAEIYRSLTAD
jgi:PTS system nitrogen regulatory IIA component